MGVSIWEGQKASDLIDAVKSTRNEVGITQNFADALLAVLDEVSFNSVNGAIALNNLREVMNAILADDFVAMTNYYALNSYGPSNTPNGYHGLVARNDRSTLVSELQEISIPTKSSTSATDYDTTIPYSFIRIPAGASKIKQINTASATFNMRPLIYDGSHFVLPGEEYFFGAQNNTYIDVTNYNNGQYYLQAFNGGTIASGTAAAVIFI